MKNLRKILLIVLFVFLSTGCAETTENQIAEQLELGERYLSEGNYEEAIVAFQKVIEIDKKNVAAYIGMADAYIGLDELDMAKDILESGLLEVEDEQLHKKLEEILRLIKEKNSKELEKKAEEKPQNTKTEELLSTDTATVEEQETTEEAVIEEATTKDETIKVGVDTKAVDESNVETEMETETDAIEIIVESETEEAMPADVPTIEVAQEQKLELKITEPIPVDVYGVYHLGDVISGITDTTTLSDIEYQVSGLTIELKQGKDDYIDFCKDGELLFSMDAYNLIRDEGWDKYEEIQRPLSEAFEIYGDFSGPNADKLLVIYRQVYDELEAYLLGKRIRRDIEIYRENWYFE